VEQEVLEDRPPKDISLASIPAFPTVALRVLDVVSQDEPDFDLLVREIVSDATISAQVLRLANSSLFGFAKSIGTVKQAVIVLGAKQVQSLVMSVATATYSRAALRTEALQRCWQHTIATAVLCREIAEAAGTLQPEQAYSLGLLHDIGRLGLLVAWPHEYDLMLQKADRDAISLLELEKRLFTMDHCEVGRLLVEQWKLPHEFCVVAGRHHDPPAGATELNSLRIANLSCRLADALDFWVIKPFQPVDPEAILSELPDAVRVRLPSDPLELREKISNSIGGETASVSHRQPDSECKPGVGSNAPGVKSDPPETASTAAPLTRFESQPAAWDALVVMITVIIVTLGLATAYALSRLR
jgi:HD-like signal output (HDOD) protein